MAERNPRNTHSERAETDTSSVAENALKPASTPLCGVIMAISATERFTADHWRDVNVLVHRCIKTAGFSPKNVWENSAADRVSERIIGNIFECPIVIADISDLNPNVMLEVGLRLSSKKPTIVMMASDSIIPFDLRDFHALEYPSNLNIIGMELFFQRLVKVLKEKFDAFNSDTYTPFLGNVIVDVISPEKRELGPDQLVLKRLEEMNSSLQRVLTTQRARDPRDTSARTSRTITIKDDEGVIMVYLPSDKYDSFREAAMAMYEIDNIEQSIIGNETRARLRYSGCLDTEEFSAAFHELVGQHGGRFRAPGGTSARAT